MGERMDDAHLEHLCKLAAIKATTLTDNDLSRAEWMAYIRSCSKSDLWNEFTCLSIMAEAFVELSARAGMKPTFRIPATSMLTEKPVEVVG